MRKQLFQAARCLAMLMLLGLISGAVLAEESNKDLVDTAIEAGSFKTLVAAVQAAGLEDTLRKGTFTVFAPTDEAFSKLPKGTVETLLKPENKEKLIEILTYHVVPGRMPAADVIASPKADTVEGASILFSQKEDKVFADRAQIIMTDIEATNGIIHVIDQVIMPKDLAETAAVAGNFNTLLAAAKAAGLAGALKDPSANLTVFAPTDAAFAALPKGTVEELLQPQNLDKLGMILKYHILPKEMLLSSQSPETLMGESLKITRKGSIHINDATVALSDIKATNGIIHVIDQVLIPNAPEPNAEQKALEVIDLAIARGVPIFNRGNPAACAAIYEVTVQSLLTGHSEALDSKMRKRLTEALAEAKKTHDDSKRAWVFRRALDHVRKALH